MKRSLALIALTLAAACHHSGVGEGVLEAAPTSGAPGTGAAEGKALFTWNSGADASSGDIEALLPDGRSFKGTYLQVRSTTDVAAYGPYYDAWAAPWGGGSVWYGGPPDAFVTQYSGQALAHLTSAEGTRMRCKFALRDPVQGMAGGGEGDCQLSTHEEVFDAKLRETPDH